MRFSAMARIALLVALTLTSAATEHLEVTASTSIVADWVRVVGGERVAITELVPPGGDPHAWRPPPRAVARLLTIDLVVCIGAGVERPLMAVLGGRSGPTLALGEAVRAAHNLDDPRFWHNPRLVALAIEHLTTALGDLDPAGRDGYRSRGTIHLARLQALDRWLRQAVATIPPDHRLLVSSHHPFTHFGHAYGLETEALFGGHAGHGADPAAGTLVALVRRLRARDVPAVFPEAGHDQRLVATIAHEAGIVLAAPLASTSLGPPGSATGDYLGLMRENARVVVTALGGSLD